MQSKLFSRIPAIVALIAAVFVIVYIVRNEVSAVPPPAIAPEASSTEPMPLPYAPAIPSTYATVSVKAPKGSIDALIASTSDQQSLGLGQRDSLPADEGMLFPFDIPGQYGFWMKDMRFSLDMVWIAPDKRVVMVTTDISPDTYPTVVYPPSDISWVLELNAGQAGNLGIATGTQLVF